MVFLVCFAWYDTHRAPQVAADEATEAMEQMNDAMREYMRTLSEFNP